METELHEVASTANKCNQPLLQKPWNLLKSIYNCKLFKIEVVVFLYMFSRFFFLPLTQQYYFVRFGADLLKNSSFPFPNGSFCLNSSQVDAYLGNNGHKVVEKYSSNLVLYTQLATRLPGILTVLILGPLSDRIGRKPVLFSALFGTLLQAIVAWVTIFFHLSPYILILSSFLTGIFGDFTGVLAGTFSYIADVSSPKWRTFRIGMIEGTLAIGGALGQFLSGYWLNQTNCNFVPLMTLELACCIGVLLWVVFLTPESLTKEERLKRNQNSNQVKGPKALLQGLKMFLGCVPKYSAWKLWAAIIMLNVPLFNTEGGILLSVYYLKAPPFDVDATVIGLFQSIQSIARGFSVTLVLFSFSMALRLPDSVSSFIGICFQMAANTLMGLARRTIQVYFIAIVQGVEAISWAAGRSLMSKLVSKEDQGSMFSVVASVQSILSLISSVVWPLIYPQIQANPDLPTGTIYFIMAAINLVAFPIIIVLMASEITGKKKKPRSGESRKSFYNSVIRYGTMYKNSQ